MPENKVFAIIFMTGGWITKTYKNAFEAKKDLRKMVFTGKAFDGFVFEKFLFKMENHREAVFSDKFEKG